MTDMLTRATESPSEPPITDRPRPPAVGAILAAGWVGLAGVLICAAVAVTGWLAADGGTAPTAVRIGADAWLLAHHVPLDVPGGSFGLTPLGLTALLVIAFFRTGGWLARTTAVDRPIDVAIGVATFTIGYGGFAALVGVLCRIDDMGGSPWRSFGFAGAMAGLSTAAGLLTERGDIRSQWRRLPDEARSAIRGGVRAAGTLLGGALLVYLIALLVHVNRVGEFAEALDPGLVGSLLLVLMCVAYLPNAVLCTAAYVLGPGFALGTGTVVAPTGVELGPLPTFPLLAAVPGEGSPPGWALLVLVVPFIAGVVAGGTVARQHPLLGLEGAALYGAVAGLVGGLLVALSAYLAGGPIGPGRMSELGPAPVQTGVAAITALTVAGALTAMALHVWTMWRARRSGLSG